MEAAPLFSVIVPTRDRHERLTACLEALAHQDVDPSRFEVLVSDDGSRVPPIGIVERFNHRLRVQVVQGPHIGPAAARNRGAARAVGRYLVFTDDDCLAEPGWLRALDRRFAEHSGRLIAGRIVNHLPANRFSTTTELIVSYGYAENAKRSRGIRLFNGNNLAVPAHDFRALGGFSEAFPLAAGEDYDFCHRWQHAGLETIYAPEAVVRHAHALTFAGFCRQHFNYGRGLYQCRRRIAERQSTKFRVEGLGFYVGLLCYPLRQVRGAAGWIYGSLVAASQLATLVGAACEWVAGSKAKRAPI